MNSDLKFLNFFEFGVEYFLYEFGVENLQIYGLNSELNIFEIFCFQIFCMNSNLEMTMLIQRACLWQLSLCHFHSELEYTVTISLVVSFSFRARIGFGPTVTCSFPSSQNSASESFRCCCCF
ncbi:hypothetical protein ACS0TY_000686 [Phlomoides rotata]